MAILYYKASNGEFIPIGGTYALPAATEEKLGGVKLDVIINGMSTDEKVPTSKAAYDCITAYTDLKINELFSLYKTGTVSMNGTSVSIDIPSGNWYIVSITNNNIPPFSLYITKHTDELVVQKIAGHSQEAYAKATSENHKLIIHSNDASIVRYKIYKLPF